MHGDIAGLFARLGDDGIAWCQEIERDRLQGNLLMSDMQTIPRPRTEKVRFLPGITAGSSVELTFGVATYVVSLDPPQVTRLDNPRVVKLLTESFWTPWESARETPRVRSVSKAAHLLLPDRAVRSSWTIPEQVLSDVRATGQATSPEAQGIRRSYRRLAQLAPALDVRFSVKTNPDPRVLSARWEEGCGFEVTSYDEVELALQAGAPAEKVIFPAPVQKFGDLRSAWESGASLFVVDSISQINRVAKAAPGARCLARIRTSADRYALIDLSTKFGIPPG